MSGPRRNPNGPSAPQAPEGGLNQPEQAPAEETGMVTEAKGERTREPDERERPGGMIGEG